MFLSLPSAASLSPEETNLPSVTDLPVEETEKRTAETKTFLMPDGTHTFRSYGTLVHKPAPDGTWTEIDNRLIEDKETGGFVTADGLETVRFAADTPAVSIESEKGKLSWTVAPYEGESLEKALAAVTDVTDTAWYKSSSPEEQAMVAVKLDGAISYTFPERSLRVDYSVSPGTVKENFVLLAPADGRFKLTLSGLTAEQKGQTVSLFNQEGEELFVITAPYMYDAAGAESDEIELVLTDENTLLVLPSEEWLNSPERVYPVTIDPTYTSSQVTADIKDTYVHEGDSAGDHYNETKMYVGNRNSQKHYAYVKVPLDDLPDGIIAFNSASLKLYLPDVTSSWFPFLLRASNQAWASDTISWNNRPNLYPDIDSSGWSTTAGVVSNADGSKTTTFNVLPFVSNIYRSSSLSNYGFRISYSNEAEDDYNSFYTSEYGTQSRRPQITVNYTAGGAGGNTIADGVYYITNKATGQYMTVNNDLYKITPVYQCTLYPSTAAETSRARQMWKVKYLGNGYYSIRPLHELFYGLWRSDASSNELMIYNIGTTDTVAGVVSNAQWSITGSSGNYAIRKHGDTAKTLYLPTSPGQNEPVKCGTGTNNDYSKWNFTPVSAPPQGAYLCEYNSSASAYRVVTNPTRYVAPCETRTLEDMKLRAIAYSPNTISQTFTCASSDTSVATVNASTGAITGVSPGTAVITGTSASGNTTHFTINVTEIANGTYFLKNKETGRYADIENGTMSGGTQIEQQDFDGDNAQRWIFTHLGDGYYSIKSANSSSVFYMSVSGDSTGNDVPVVLRAASLTDGAKWKISKTSSGAYKITPKTGEANDRVLAVGAYVLNTNGIDIEQRDYVDDDNYKDEWLFHHTVFYATVNNYYDNGYPVYYAETATASKAKINGYLSSISDRYAELLGLDLSWNTAVYYHSPIDICKGTVTTSNINTLCSHSGTIHTNRDNVIGSFMGTYSGNQTTTNVYWSGHRISSTSANGTTDYNRSCSCGDAVFMIERSSSYDRELNSKGVLMHELNHQFGASDHYHEEDEDGDCIRPDICSDCNGPHARPATCIMNNSRIDISNSDVICNNCKNEINSHLRDHHLTN